MLITYCTECGVRLTTATNEMSETERCQDCVEGRKRRHSRRGDSAVLRRPTTGSLLKITPVCE
jgi:hypothetical protein